MGLGESKDHNKELKLFPEEERNQLERNFERLSKGSKTKVDRQTLQVSFYTKFITINLCFNSFVDLYQELVGNTKC